MKPVNNSASPPSKRPAPLHGGPVSPWSRRVRQLIRASAALAVTCALIAVVSVIALIGATALGAMPIGLALLISMVVMYTTAGLRPPHSSTRCCCGADHLHRRIGYGMAGS